MSDNLLNNGSTAGQDWFAGLTATINDPLAANNPNFAIEMVNASTGADESGTQGTALNNSSGQLAFRQYHHQRHGGARAVVGGAAALRSRWPHHVHPPQSQLDWRIATFLPLPQSHEPAACGSSCLVCAVYWSVVQCNCIIETRSSMLIYAVDRPVLPPLKMPDRFRTDIAYLMTPAGEHGVEKMPSGEYWIWLDDAREWLADGVLSVVSPLDGLNRTEIEGSPTSKKPGCDGWSLTASSSALVG